MGTLYVPAAIGIHRIAAGTPLLQGFLDHV